MKQTLVPSWNLQLQLNLVYQLNLDIKCYKYKTILVKMPKNVILLYFAMKYFGAV